MRRIIIILVWISIIFYSCTEEKNEYLLDEETYKNVFIELVMANHLDRKLLANNDQDELIAQIYEHYGVTAEQFRYTHDQFEKNIQEQTRRAEEMLVILREERERIEKIEQQYINESGESADSLRQRLLSR